VVSYADPAEGHAGTIYQAMNWIYAGRNKGTVEYADAAGRRIHGRMVSASGRKKVYGQYRSVPTPDTLTRVNRVGKHKYLMPLDAAMREAIEPLRKPYPKRAESKDSVAPDDQSGEGSASLTSALQRNTDAPT